MDPINDQANQENSSEIKVYIDKIISNSYLFLIGIVLCTFLAVIYSKLANVSYKVTSKILVRDDKNSPGKGAQNLLGGDLSSLLGTPNNAENEIEILKSRTLMKKVVEKLNLNVTVGVRGALRSLEATDGLVPFTVELEHKADTIEYRQYTIKDVTPTKYRLTSKKEDIDTVVNFGQKLKLPQFNVILRYKTNFYINPNGYSIAIQSVDSRVEGLMDSFDASLTSKLSTVINLKLNYSVPDKGEKILGTLMDLYLEENLDDKVRIADSTIVFIDKQLDAVTADLSSIEKHIEEFKKRNQLADITVQSKVLIENSSDYFKKLNDLEIQISIIDGIASYIKSPANHRIIPSTLTINDPVFSAGIATYNQLLSERDRQSLSYTENNPIVKNLDQQIENIRKNLLKSFEQYRRNLLVSRKELTSRNNSINQRIQDVPEQERIFLNYSRQQSLKQQIYIYLLEKREETAIKKTSTFSTSQIIDPAKSDSAPFAPKKGIIYIIGLTIGVILPFAYLRVREMLNTRIVTKSDVVTKSPITIVGEISHNEDAKSLVVDDRSRSIISEQFRSLRANLQFLLKQDKPNVIMVTSSMSGEGKSFISLNLGNALAISGKKVVFIELDLRKPKLSVNMGMDNTFGFTNYVISEKVSVDEITKPLYFSANSFLISSGPIPPNPAELLLNSKVEQLIEDLKKRFDYIIIDTAPVGLVSDALIIEKYADVCLYIIRQEYTYKTQLNIANELVNTKKLSKAYFVVNDIQSSKGGYYGYGYGGYGYGYGYGYGGYGGYVDENSKKGWLAKLLKRNKR
jgi:tyrosine-protein kinase Etk/Wzc